MSAHPLILIIEDEESAAGGVEIRILLPGPGAGPLSATAEIPS